jgi:hypothetical protein
MTPEDFKIFWTLNYPETVPISYLFKNVYARRWFRIHSLPDSKRFAHNDKEWSVLLNRQNEIFTDLFGADSKIILVTGEYNWGERNIHIIDEEEVFKNYDFLRLDNIDLYKLNSDDYDEGEIYRPAFAETVWFPNQHDKLLIEIANDKTRAFFVSFDKNVVAAPYDGGVDFILKDSMTRDIYKIKYKEWLSIREDGL